MVILNLLLVYCLWSMLGRYAFGRSSFRWVQPAENSGGRGGAHQLRPDEARRVQGTNPGKSVGRSAGQSGSPDMPYAAATQTRVRKKS